MSSAAASPRSQTRARPATRSSSAQPRPNLSGWPRWQSRCREAVAEPVRQTPTANLAPRPWFPKRSLQRGAEAKRRVDVGLVRASTSVERPSVTPFSQSAALVLGREGEPRDSRLDAATYSMGTRSLMMMLPNDLVPPAPSPHSALAMIKVSMLPATAHSVVASVNTRHAAQIQGFPVGGVREPT